LSPLRRGWEVRKKKIFARVTREREKENNYGRRDGERILLLPQRGGEEGGLTVKLRNFKREKGRVTRSSDPRAPRLEKGEKRKFDLCEKGPRDTKGE